MIHPPGNNDEAMLRNKDHPSHTSGGREGGTAACLVLIASLVLFLSVDISWLSSFWKTTISVFTAAAVGWGVGRWFGSRDGRSKSAAQREFREAQEANRQRQMDEAIRTGRFARFGEK